MPKDNNWAGNRKGCQLTAEHKQKIATALKGRLVKEETRIKLHNALSNRVFSPETIKRMSIAAKDRVLKNGVLKYWEGKKNPNMQGSKHWNWKGGVTPENKKIRESSEYDDFRRKVLIRDKYTCSVCGRVSGSWIKEEKRKVVLHVHHIKSFAEFPELRLEVSNGISLCEDCHRETY
jgi:hypothetical protein